MLALATGLTIAVISSEPFEIQFVTGQVLGEVTVEIECQQIRKAVDTNPVQCRFAGVFGFDMEAVHLAGYSTRQIRIGLLPRPFLASALWRGTRGESVLAVAMRAHGRPVVWLQQVFTAPRHAVVRLVLGVKGVISADLKIGQHVAGGPDPSEVADLFDGWLVQGETLLERPGFKPAS